MSSVSTKIKNVTDTKSAQHNEKGISTQILKLSFTYLQASCLDSQKVVYVSMHHTKCRGPCDNAASWVHEGSRQSRTFWVLVLGSVPLFHNMEQSHGSHALPWFPE